MTEKKQNVFTKKNLKTQIDATRKILDHVERFVEKPGNPRFNSATARGICRRQIGRALKNLANILVEL